MINSIFFNELRERMFQEWCAEIDTLLDSKIRDDLGGSGIYLDDEIGEESFNWDVESVKDNMAKVLWDCYNDNINDIVKEEVGSDCIDTI